MQTLKKIIKIPDWSADPDLKKMMDSYESYLKEEQERIWKKIIFGSIGVLKVPQPIINCCRKINLSTFPNYNSETIGQLLGKSGQHKQFFVNLTKVDLEIDKKAESTIVLGKYNAIAVAKAVELIKKLLAVGKWNQDKMSSLYEEVCKEWREKCIVRGTEILKDFLNYKDGEFTEELARCTGTLEYIYSFNQNILEHSMEVAQLTSNMASQLDLNALKAKRAGFFHDIGKATANLDDHVKEGVRIAKEAKLEPYIVHAIEHHHDKDMPSQIKIDHPYSALAQVADKLSAGREGARPRQIELIQARKEMIESRIVEIEWVDKVHIENAGNSLHVFIKPSAFDEKKIPLMKSEIKTKLIELSGEYKYNFEIEFLMMYHEIFFLSDI